MSMADFDHLNHSDRALEATLDRLEFIHDYGREPAASLVEIAELYDQVPDVNIDGAR
jgi:hypothetical protein